MFKKFGIGMLAIALAAIFSAFTAPAKPAPAEVRTMDLFWYQVVNGVIPQNAPVYDHGAKASIASPCTTGNQRDCLRGFENELNTSTGDINAAGDDQIKTNQQP